MEFINIETKKIFHLDFEIFDTKSNEYFEEDVEFSYDFERLNKKKLDYTLTITFKPIQKKKGKGSKITVRTIFSFTASEKISPPLDGTTIKWISILLGTAWSYTTVLFNLLSHNSIFENDFLSDKPTSTWYEQLKEDMN